MPETVIHVMPRPAIYRAGAVWVTATNWSRATQRRWGNSIIWTGDAIHPGHARPDADQSQQATPGRQLRLPAAASTFAKDVRWWREDSRYVVEDLVREIRDRDPAFVWQHHDLFLNGGTRLARRLGVPLVQFVDAMIVWEARRWGVSRRFTGGLVERHGEHPALKAADLVACVTEEVAEHVSAIGIPDERVLVTPCTAEIADFEVTDGRKQRWREQLGFDGHHVIGWVGSFRRFHAVDLLIRAMPHVLQRHPNARLLLVGDGPQRLPLLEQAADHGISNAIFAPGAAAHSDMPGVLAAMDIAVLTAAANQPFHYSPLKLREYLAAGKPVIAPDIGDPGRILDHGSTGRLYPPGDATALAAQIVSLISEPKRAAAMALAGKEMHRMTGQIEPQLEVIASSLKL